MTRIMMLIMGLAGLSLSGCNTVEGVGEDIQYGGQVITDTADDVEGEI